MTSRRLGAAALVAGLLVAAAAQVVSPAPPVYDGVVPFEPYRWVIPPTGYPADPKGASESIAVIKGGNDLVAVATPEQPPQAQVYATPGTLRLPRGATSVEVSVAAIAATSQPAGGYIDGNVYRISLTDQAGNPVSARAAGNVTVILRAANAGLPEAQVARLDGSTWKPLATSAYGAGIFAGLVTEFGDFAVIADGLSPYPSSGASGSGPATPASTTDVRLWLVLGAVFLTGLVIIGRAFYVGRRGGY